MAVFEETALIPLAESKLMLRGLGVDLLRLD